MKWSSQPNFEKNPFTGTEIEVCIPPLLVNPSIVHCSIFIAAFEGEIAGPIFKNICPHHVQIGSGGPGLIPIWSIKTFFV